MRLTTIIVLMAIALLLFSGCAQAEANEQVGFACVNDIPKLAEPVSVMDMVKAEKTQEQQAEQQEAEYEEYYEPDYYEPAYTGDGFKQQGVRDYNGRTETWYSSNQLYHYRTGEWSVDDEGYYRDEQGRYIVAASDIPEGSEIETSKGTGIVLDSGCDAGVTDFYVAF